MNRCIQGNQIPSFQAVEPKLLEQSKSRVRACNQNHSSSEGREGGGRWLSVSEGGKEEKRERCGKDQQHRAGKGM